MNNTELAEELRAMNMRLCNKAADELEAAQAAASKQATDNNKIVDLIAKQRDEALARLAEIEKQEPVAVVTAVSPTDFIARVINENAAVLCIGASIYAAAGASPEPNEWKEAVLNTVALYSMDFPIETPPLVIVNQLIGMAVTMAKDPAINVQPSQAVELTQQEAEEFAHRRASRYTHRTDPTYVAYTFLPHTLMDFVRDITATINAKGDAS